MSETLSQFRYRINQNKLLKDEVTNWRLGYRQWLMDRGYSPEQAGRISWDKAMERWPRPDPVVVDQQLVVQEPEPEEEWIEGDLKDAPFDLARDSTWVYSHFKIKVEPSDAPSPGAWAFLTWARKNPDKFFQIVLPKSQPKPKAEDEATKRSERLHAEHCRLLLEAIGEPEVEEAWSWAEENGIPRDKFDHLVILLRER